MVTRLRLVTVLLTLLLGAVLGGHSAAAQSDEGAFTVGALGNATYMTGYTDATLVTLEDGHYTSEGGPESSAYLSVTLLEEPIAIGDLTGDGVDEAAVLLGTNTGGSGVFIDLAVMVQGDSGPLNVAVTFLGDRVRPISMTIVDELIALELIVQGPDDPMCCPALPTLLLFSLDENELILESESMIEDDAEAALNPDSPPTVAALRLGEGGIGWANPTLVSILIGLGPDEERLDAQTLDETCLGSLPVVPTVVVDWGGDPDVESLLFFTLALGDPNMVVVTPYGGVYCSDDMSEASLNPEIRIDEPVAGRYAIFVGSNYPDDVLDSFLVIRGEPSDFAASDFQTLMMFGGLLYQHEQVNEDTTPDETRHSPPGSTVPLEAPAAAVLGEADLPLSVDVAAGGTTSAIQLSESTPACLGFVADVPSLTLDWQGAETDVSIFAEANEDTTLLVRGPDGDFICSDDVEYQVNLNPQAVVTLSRGPWNIWVGGWSNGGPTIEAVLTVSDDPAALPEILGN